MKHGRVWVTLNRYIALPPCLWGSKSEGLQPPVYLPEGTPMYSIKRNHNTRAGHYGEMASWQMRGVPFDANKKAPPTKSPAATTACASLGAAPVVPSLEAMTTPDPLFWLGGTSRFVAPLEGLVAPGGTPPPQRGEKGRLSGGTALGPTPPPRD